MVIRGSACIWGRSGSSSSSESGSGVLSGEERLKLPAAGGLGPSRLTNESSREEGSAVVVVVVVVALPPEGPGCGSLVGSNGLVIGSVGELSLDVAVVLTIPDTGLRPYRARWPLGGVRLPQGLLELLELLLQLLLELEGGLLVLAWWWLRLAMLSCPLSPVQLLHDVRLSIPPDLPRQLGQGLLHILSKVGAARCSRT